MGTSNESSRTRTVKSPKFLVIGAGSRGNAYARAVTNSTNGVIHAIAEPDAFKRQEFGRIYIWGSGSPTEGQEFADWKEWLQWEKARRNGEGGQATGVDGVFICTLDETHVEILLAIAPLNLHILCEKPLATSLQDCLAISRALKENNCLESKIFSIGHVLRYSPHNTILRKLLLEDRIIGEITSLEHTEPVGWYHFSHSFVRGNWRRETANGDGSLLTKCSHDIDFILWLLCYPAPGTTFDHPHHSPQSITSIGSLTQFRQSRKPIAAGNATNCLSCPAEKDCIYSALKIYKDRFLSKGLTGWPIKIVCPDIEDTFRTSGMAAAESLLLRALAEDYDKTTTPAATIAARPWFGRCVYEADNNVLEDQVVTLSWDDDPLPETTTTTTTDGMDIHARLRGRGAKTATLHMVAATESQCERRGRVYGTLGELTYDSKTISIYNFGSGETTVVQIPEVPPEETEAHGGGDYGLARAYVKAVEAVDSLGWEVARAQREIVGCTFEEALKSHATVFAAEEARRDGKVLGWGEWWAGKVKG
ncbi:oxidoreductase [Blastomyces dermatitidis ER-3]|uniref:Oxidoreductase n=2 Tax=Blastomyces TaxID=229219 RepID=A0A179UQM5_BLAGS|nr:oxidoreductase [Blastomyces gilchristii SLH14081]XP_045272084.1 oxidoreductase [Blastomyces dermatitidis ER-3]EEQ84009.1 oxidoreductase [Blastomyces dermatitidis ER-3]EQL36222.1 oxidoreductase [Blastomyces dermatitidis ATCC 26199]OAT10406.1 oxidoreductase [Blastomyces gilchristii SLH14081]